jgi:hypothetical protein
MKKEKKSLLFCEQKRSKKNFDSHDVTRTVAQAREAEQKFFGSRVPMIERHFAAKSESGRAIWFKKRTAFF